MTKKRNFVGGGLHSGLLGNMPNGTSMYNAGPDAYGVRVCL